MYTCDICSKQHTDPSLFRRFGWVEANDKSLSDDIMEICIDCIPEFLGIDVDANGYVVNTISSSFFEDKT
jgi:hypothetical protein